MFLQHSKGPHLTFTFWGGWGCCADVTGIGSRIYQLRHGFHHQNTCHPVAALKEVEVVLAPTLQW